MIPRNCLAEPVRVAEPQTVNGFSDLLTRVAVEGRPVIVCRNGQDTLAVVPPQWLDMLQEIQGRREAEELAVRIDWSQARNTLRPPEQWLEGEEPRPF
jgi:hypothetical protein